MSGDALWLGVDLGTSAVKVVAVDEDGDVVTTASRAYPLSSPHPGWVEQSPQDWWEATVEALRAVTDELGGARIAALGLSGQMHGMVALDGRGAVVRDAVLWNDNRNGAECAWLLDQVGGLDGLVRLTNNAALPGYTVGKILWLRGNERDSFDRTRMVLNPKDYLRYRLTGDHATDVSDASGTGLLDVRARAWSTDLMAALDLSPQLLPPVVESTTVTGRVTEQAAARTGIPQGTSVAGGGGDAVLQTTSMGIASPGPLGITLGTAGIVAAGADTCPENTGGLVQVSCGNAPARWHVMGVALTTGGALQWWREALAPLTGSAPETDALADLAMRSPVGARGLQFLPYLVGERCPHIDPAARGAWVGLDLRHDLADMTRSVIEGALLNLRQVRDILADLGLPVDDVRVSGGALANDIWLQTLADVFGTPVQRVTAGEQGAAYGAALLAGVADGRWSSLDEALGRVHVVGSTVPSAEHAAVHDSSYATFRRIHPVTTEIHGGAQEAR